MPAGAHAPYNLIIGENPDHVSISPTGYNLHSSPNFSFINKMGQKCGNGDDPTMIIPDLLKIRLSLMFRASGMLTFDRRKRESL